MYELEFERNDSDNTLNRLNLLTWPLEIKDLFGVGCSNCSGLGNDSGDSLMKVIQG